MPEAEPAPEAVETSSSGVAIKAPTAAEIMAAREAEAAAPEMAEPVEVTPEPEAADTPEAKPLEIHLISTDQVASRSHEVAEQRLSSEMAGKHGVRKILTNIWIGNIARDVYLTRYGRQAQSEIEENDDLYVHETDTEGKHDQAMAATLQRFSNDMLHAEAGESKESLDDTQAGRELRGELEGLITEFAAGRLDVESLEGERIRVLNDVLDKHPELEGAGRIMGDNLVAMAEQIAAKVNHDQTVEQILAETKFYIDRASTGVRTEVRYTPVEKILDSMRRHHMSGLANEAVVATGVSIAYSVARWSARSTLGTVSRLTIPGVSTGIMAGLRENKRFKEERTQHSREMAVSRQIEAESARREAMEQARYQTINASELSAKLKDSLFEVDEHGDSRKRELTAEQFELALVALSEAEGRIQLSDRQQLDLISYSDLTNVEQERLGLDLAVAEAKVELSRQFADLPADQRAGFANFEEFLQARVGTEQQALSAEIASKDRIFDHMKAKSVAKAAAKGALIGAAFGLATQEATAFIRSDQTGLVEKMFHHGKPEGGHQTLLRHMFGGKVEQKPGPTVEIGAANQVKLSHNTLLNVRQDGNYDLTRSDGSVIAEKLHFSGGTLDQHSQDVLHHLGISATAEHLQTQTTETIQRSANEFVNAHPEAFSQIHRIGWYDNNTPHIFDKNELKMYWGGNNGLDANGNYVYNISHMTAGGSVHGGLSTNAQQLISEGHARLLISASKDTQGHVIQVPIDANGNAIIDKASVAGKFFRTENGHAVFTGKYAEVAEVNGPATDGIERFRMLATEVGPGTAIVSDTVTKSVDHVITHINVPPRTVIDVPPVVPIYGRRPLEPTASRAEREATVETSGELLSLFEVKEAGRLAVARLKDNDWMTPADRRRVAANIGRISQHMDKNEVTQTDLISLLAAFETLRATDPDNISQELLDKVRLSITAIEKQLATQEQNGWVRGVSAPTASPAHSPLEPEPEVAERSELKRELADHVASYIGESKTFELMARIIHRLGKPVSKITVNKDLKTFKFDPDSGELQIPSTEPKLVNAMRRYTAFLALDKKSSSEEIKLLLDYFKRRRKELGKAA